MFLFEASLIQPIALAPYILTGLNVEIGTSK